jgi:TATA-binding protein-associated factor Taf7
VAAKIAAEDEDDDDDEYEYESEESDDEEGEGEEEEEEVAEEVVELARGCQRGSGVDGEQGEGVFAKPGCWAPEG